MNVSKSTVCRHKHCCPQQDLGDHRNALSDTVIGDKKAICAAVLTLEDRHETMPCITIFCHHCNRNSIVRCTKGSQEDIANHYVYLVREALRIYNFDAMKDSATTRQLIPLGMPGVRLSALWKK
jgi:hypothetical protein